MKTISFALTKGGVGKTSISLAAAFELARNGKKVLLVDADPQGNLSSAVLDELQSEFADILLENKKINDVIVHSKFNNIDVVPTFPVDTRLREYKHSAKVNEDIYAIEDCLNEVRDNYDFCIIDVSPDFSVFEKNVFWCCDEIVPVMNCDTFSSDGLTVYFDNIGKFRKQRRKTNLEVKTVVMNRYNPSMKLDKGIKELIDSQEGMNKVVVPQDQDFKVSQASRRELQGRDKTMEAIRLLTHYIA